jgi:hypothetical protein
LTPLGAPVTMIAGRADGLMDGPADGLGREGGAGT